MTVVVTPFVMVLGNVDRTVIVNDLIVENGGKDLLEKFEASSV